MQFGPTTLEATNLDIATFERMLSLGGDALRPALIQQLLVDFGRLRLELEGDDATTLCRAAHELKGLSATIGAIALAEQAARFDGLATVSTPAVRRALALGLQQQIDGLAAEVRARGQNSTAA